MKACFGVKYVAGAVPGRVAVDGRLPKACVVAPGRGSTSCVDVGAMENDDWTGG
jgi:hypothetical protein